MRRERLEPFFLVDDLDDLEVGAALWAHLRARRLRRGDSVVVGDGRGWLRDAVVEQIGRDGVVLRATSASRFVERHREPVVVASFVPSRDRLSWMVQKLGELGVDELVLLVAPHDRRGGEALAPSELDRLRRVAREAAQQSEQPWVLRITGPRTVSSIAGDAWAVADPEGSVPPATLRRVIVGPESGRVDGAEGLPRIRLPGGVLRVETAAVVAGALLLALRDGIVDAERSRNYADAE